MLKQTTFRVETGSQSPMTNKLLRCADLGVDGTFVDNGCGYDVEIIWNKGKVVNAAHIEKVKNALQKEFEKLGFCVLEIAIV